MIIMDDIAFIVIFKYLNCFIRLAGFSRVKFRLCSYYECGEN